jgi:hypothetical protein
MMKLKIVFFLLVFSAKSYADSFCGVVLAENGLNVRSKPSLQSEVLYKLHQGQTFKFYSDGYTEIFETIKDGNETLKGQWIKIDLYTSNESSEPNEGYILLTPKYAEEIYDCREFRHRILENELYSNTYDQNEYREKRVDTLKTIVQLEYYHLKTNSISAQKDLYPIEEGDFTILTDTISLNLDNGEVKHIVSYPFGKNDNEDFTEVYSLVGYSSRINSFLIQGSYWESGDYFFVNKQNGAISSNFYGQPIISPSSMFMLVLQEDEYE